ncbi:hypothetical protein EV2_028820 [Malus domestica]
MATMDVEIGGDRVVLTEEPPPNEMKHRESKTTLQSRSSTLPLSLTAGHSHTHSLIGKSISFFLALC